MFPEESALRRELAQRAFRSPGEIWPAVRRELVRVAERAPRPAAASWTSAALAVLLMIVLFAILRGRPEHAERRLPGKDFSVTNVRSLGRPSTPIVLRPDPNTLMVVVD